MTRPDYYGNPSGLTADADAVRAIYAAFARRDPEAALPFIDENCELHLRGTAAVTGRAEPYIGHAGVRQYFADASEIWDELVLHADDFRVMPGIVIALGHVDLRRGEVSASRAVIWTWQLRDGKAISVKVADAGEYRGPGQ
jgi:ketosteroid isomerase-like protein